MLQQMLHLDRRVERQQRVPPPRLLQNPQHVLRCVQKIRICERHMLRAHRRQLVDVRQHPLCAVQSQPPFVDRRQRAVRAGVRASPRRLHRPPPSAARPSHPDTARTAPSRAGPTDPGPAAPADRTRATRLRPHRPAGAAADRHPPSAPLARLLPAPAPRPTRSPPARTAPPSPHALAPPTAAPAAPPTAPPCASAPQPRSAPPTRTAPHQPPQPLNPAPAPSAPPPAAPPPAAQPPAAAAPAHTCRPAELVSLP